MTGNFSQDVRLLMQTPTYLQSSQEARDQLVGALRDEFISKSPDAAQYYNSEAENAQVEFLRSTGQGRRINNNLKFDAPWDSPDWEFMMEDEKEQSIESFRSNIPTIAKQDRLNYGDNEFFLNSVADAQLRKAKGEDTGWIADKAYRTFDGFAAGLASYVGAEDLANSIRKTSSENPKYDEDFMSTLFQGAGDMAASTTIFLGATLGGTALTGNPIAGGYVGATATLATNSIARYNEAYRQAIEQGLNEEQASDAGIYALPGAAIDAVGDKLIAGKFLPNNYAKSFTGATTQQKRDLIAELVRDKSKAGIILNTAKASFAEGLTEAGGDYTAGYGAFLATGETEFIPTNTELRDSFIVGAILGGAVTGTVESIKSFSTDKELINKTQDEVNRLTEQQPTDEEAAKKVWELMDQGRFKEAYDLSQQIQTTPTQEESQAEPEININSETAVSSFIPKSEQEESITLPSKEVEEEPIRILPEEEQASNKLSKAPKQFRENFDREVRNQFSLYAGTPNELGSELRGQPVAETSIPFRGLRFGVSETIEGLGTESDEFARDITSRVNNIQLVAPGSGTPSQRTADFSLRDRTKPEGDITVQPSPELQTKVDEAIAMGRQNELLSILPVNSMDAKRQSDAKVPIMNINFETEDFDVEGELNRYIKAPESLDQMIQNLDTQFGKNNWVVKDSQGAASEGIYVGEKMLRDAYSDSEDGILLNGLYAESYNDNLARRQPGGDQRVHIIKRGGQLEVVPYATHNRNHSLPYIARTDSVRGIEEAALNYAKTADAAIPEGGMMGVDVVITADGSLLATELNPTQYGSVAEYYGVGGSSGFAGTPYIQSAIYSHLKGRVPAFALAGRQILREEFTKQALDQGAPRIATQIQRMVGNARDAAALKQQLLQNYGEKFSDYSEQIWDAFVESAGQITQKIIDLIQRIIDMVRFRPVDGNVSTVNQPVMNQAKANTALVNGMARQKIKNNSLPFNVNPAYGIDDHRIPMERYKVYSKIRTVGNLLKELVSDTEYEYRDLAMLVMQNTTAFTKKAKIKWEKNGYRNFYSGIDHQITFSDDVSQATILHEIIHAATSSAVQSQLANAGIKLNYKNKNGVTYKASLDQALESDRVSEPVKELIRLYFKAATDLGYYNELFVGNPLARTRLKTKSIASNSTWLTANNEGNYDPYIQPGGYLINELKKAGYGDYITTLVESPYPDISSMATYAIDWNGIKEKARQDGYTFKMDPVANDGYFSYSIKSVEEVTEVISNGLAGPGINSSNTAEAGIPYGLANLDEFMAESWTDAELQNLLNKIPSDKPGKSIWQAFKDALLKIFPWLAKTSTVEGRTLLDDVAEVTSQLFRKNEKLINDVEMEFNARPRNLRQQRLQQLKDLKQHKIEDRFDSNTSSLLASISKLKVSHIDLLPPDLKDRVYQIIENIWKARKEKIEDPQARINTATLLDELDILQMDINSHVIEKRIKDLDGIYDLSGFDVDNGTLEEFEAYINELSKQDEAFQEKKRNRDAKRKASYEKKMIAWRQSYADIRNQIREKWQSAEHYLQDYETDAGQPIKSKKLRAFMVTHFDYLTTLADVSSLEGRQLYRHFFAINNLLDGSLMYGADTTAAYLQQLRDGEININSLESKFRDPVINQGRGFIGGLDAAQRHTEIAQTQLSRWSAFVEAKDFLQKDLMGPLLETITLDAKNMESESLRKYDAAKKEFEKTIGREMNGEDRVVMSLASRLIQFAAGKDGNKEFQRNLRNEWKNIYNIVGDPNDPKKIGSGTVAQQSDYQRVVIPTLESLVEGLADSPNPMEQFIMNINSRMGLGDDAVGKARADLLNVMQSIMSEYALDTKIVSEAFYNKPFTQYINYLPRLVIPINPEQYNARNGEISDEVEKFDQNYYQAAGLEAEPGQIQERNGIGNKGHYSQNIEYIFSRGIHVAALTATTTSERHILNKRLKGGIIRDLINGSNSTYRVDQLQQWARQVMAHAMHSGQPLGTIGVVMKALNESFARVSLSGLHQGVTQTISGYTDYHFRTGNIVGAMQAASFYIQKKEAMDAFFQNNAAWIGERSFLGEQELDRRRNISFDEKKFTNHPAMKFFSKFHDKAGEIITYSLRKGDDFTARSLVLAEYTRLLKEKNPTISSIQDVDFSVPEGALLSQAILNVEQNINASNKATRGEFFVDRNRGMAFLRNITVAFSSHVMMLAGQFNIAIRDLVDLHESGGSKADKARAIRTIGAIIGQTLSFSSSRYVINGAMAAAMISLLRDLFDDEEGKIARLNERIQYAKDIGNKTMQAHLEDELKAATIIRRQIDKFSQRQTGFSSYWKNAVKDELGSMHFMFNGPQLPQKLIFPIFDNFGEMLMKEDQEARVTRMKERIAKLKKQRQFGAAARLSEELILIENAEYLPWNIDQFGSIGLGGITGTALNAIYASLKEFNDAAYGLTEVNLNDFVMSAQSAGIGQADLLRFTKVVDKIEDDLFKADVEQAKRTEELRNKKARERLDRANTIENDQVLREILGE